MADPRFGINFAKQPDWLILKVHNEIKLKKLAEINDNSKVTAILSSIIVNALGSFSKTKRPTVSYDDFLPYKIPRPDTNPLFNFISELTASKVARMWEKGELPPKLIQLIGANPNLHEVIKFKGDL